MLTLHVQWEIYRVEEKGINFSEHNIIIIKVCLVQNWMLDTIMDKILGTFVALFLTIHLFNPSPHPPPPYNVGNVYTGGWGGEEATHFETDNSALLKLRFKNTENYCNYTSVPRNFVHHCLNFTSHGKMHNYDVF